MTTRHTTLVLGMVCLIAFMIMPSIPAMANENACDSLEKTSGSGNGKSQGNDRAQSNNDCEETGSGGSEESPTSTSGGQSSGSTSGGQSSGSCDMNSDGVISAAELLAFTGTSIDWQAVIDSIEASLSGSDTNNNGLIDTSAEFVELKRVSGC